MKANYPLFHWQLVIALGDLIFAQEIKEHARTLGARVTLSLDLKSFKPSKQLETLTVILVSPHSINDPLVGNAIENGICEVKEITPSYALLLLVVGLQAEIALPSNWRELPIICVDDLTANTNEKYDKLFRALNILTGEVVFFDDNVETNLFKGKIMRHHNRLFEATLIFSKAANRWPQNYTAWFNLGVAYSLASDDQWLAVDAFKHALMLEPESLKSWFWLASRYKELGESKEARFAYLRTLELDDKFNLLTGEERADILNFDLRDYSKALDAYDRVKKEYPDEMFMFYDIANIYLHLSRYEEAIEAYNKYLVEYPDDGRALYNKAWALKSIGHINEAIKTALLAIDALRGDNPIHIDELADCYQLYGNLLMQINHFEGACEAFEQSLQLVPYDELTKKLYEESLKKI